MGNGWSKYTTENNTALTSTFNMFHCLELAYNERAEFVGISTLTLTDRLYNHRTAFCQSFDSSLDTLIPCFGRIVDGSYSAYTKTSIYAELVEDRIDSRVTSYKLNPLYSLKWFEQVIRVINKLLMDSRTYYIMRTSGNVWTGRSYLDNVYYPTYLQATEVAVDHAVNEPIVNTSAGAVWDGITFTASLSGQIGNHIHLFIDGIKTVQEIVDYWNTGNSPNSVTYTGRGPDYVPASYGQLWLRGGTGAIRPEHTTWLGKYNDIGPNCKYATVYCTNIIEEIYVGQFASKSIDITLIRTVSGNNFGNSRLSTVERQAIPLSVTVGSDGFFALPAIPGENDTNFIYPANEDGDNQIGYAISDYVYINNGGNFKFIAGS